MPHFNAWGDALVIGALIGCFYKGRSQRVEVLFISVSSRPLLEQLQEALFGALSENGKYSTLSGTAPLSLTQSTVSRGLQGSCLNLTLIGLILISCPA